MTARPPPVYGFCVGVEGWPERFEINASSMSAARSQIWREARAKWRADLPFAAVKARKLLRPATSEILRAVQASRGRPDLVAGALVSIQGDSSHLARVVDADGGACFVVLCEGERLTVHPADLAVVEEG